MGGGFDIGGARVSNGAKPFVIAELSANHLGSKSAALETIDAAAAAGATAVKFQHFTPDTITVRSDHPDFTAGGGTVWDGRQLADLYQEAMTPWEWTEDLVDRASQAGLVWLSSPFDTTAIDFLDDLDVPAFKIASFEIVDLPLIRAAASRGKPLIISTGMATVGEIDAAVEAAVEAGVPGLALLRCNSGYPTEPSEMDLRAIPTMAQLWQLPIGLSDHSRGSTAAIVSVALGACIIEKHLTMRRSDGGPDAAFSAEPDEFAAMVNGVSEAFAELGETRFGPSAREVASRRFRRSLRAVRPIAAGDQITPENVRSVRPAGGLAPDEIETVLGLTATRDLPVGEPLKWTDLASGDL